MSLHLYVPKFGRHNTILSVYFATQINLCSLFKTVVESTGLVSSQRCFSHLNRTEQIFGARAAMVANKENFHGRKKNGYSPRKKLLKL